MHIFATLRPRELVALAALFALPLSSDPLLHQVLLTANSKGRSKLHLHERFPGTYQQRTGLEG